MATKTPQEKKKLSLERDRRNVYGRAPHAARKLIPLNKARRNRRLRYHQDQQLSYCGPSLDTDAADELESRMFERVPQGWEKCPGKPLGEVIVKKRTTRAKAALKSS